MAAYALQGTPTLILVDRRGFLRKQKFGQESDMELGAGIMALILDQAGAAAVSDAAAPSGGCADGACEA